MYSLWHVHTDENCQHKKEDDIFLKIYLYRVHTASTRKIGKMGHLDSLSTALYLHPSSSTAIDVFFFYYSVFKLISCGAIKT